MNYQEFKEEVIKASKEAGIETYELYYEATESTSLDVYLHEVNTFNSSAVAGVCYRCIVDGKAGYASTESFSKEEAEALVERAADNARTMENEEEICLCEKGEEYQKISYDPYEMPSTDRMVKDALACQEYLYAADSRIQDGSQTNIIAEKSEVCLDNSNGVSLKNTKVLFAAVAAAVVADGEEKNDSFEIRVENPATMNLEEVAKDAARRAVDKLGAGSVATQTCPVVFSQKAMADLLRTFSGIFSAENVQKGMSLLKGKEQEKVASSCITLVDTPFFENSPAQVAFDAEGCATKEKEIIKEGVLTTFLHNMKTAKKAGVKTTGNASKAGYADEISIRPLHFYIKPQQKSFDELLELAQNGVYITEVGGLHAGANPVTGDFSLQSSGFLIEDGKKTRPVKSFTVAGNFYSLLENVKEVGNDLKMNPAITSSVMGSPSILVSAMSIAGK